MRKRLITRIWNVAIVAAMIFTVGATTTQAKIPAPLAAALPHPAAPAVVGGADWPMHFQNAQRTSYSPNENLISRDKVGNLIEYWAQSILAGAVPASSPVIYQGRAYVGGPGINGTPNFFSFDTTGSGTAPWSVTLGTTGSPCGPVGLASTAAVQGDTIVTGGADNNYYGLNTNGGTKWVQSSGNGTNYYAWASPLIYTPSTGGTRTVIGVASSCDQGNGNGLVAGEERAYDLGTGLLQRSFRTIPATALKGGPVWQDAALNSDGTKLIITTGNDDPQGYQGKDTRSIVVLDAVTFQLKDDNQQGAPGVDQDWASGPTIFHGGFSSTPQELVGAQLKVGYQGGYHAYILNPNGSLNLKWVRSDIVEAIGLNAAYDPTPIAASAGGVLYIPSNGSGGHGIVYGVNPDTGATISLPDAPMVLTLPHNDIWGQMALAKGLLFINDGGYLEIYDSHTFAHLREITPSHGAGANYSGVTIAHGIVYWVSGGMQTDYLNAWGLPTQ